MKVFGENIGRDGDGVGADGFTVGPLRLESRALLAPMAGVTDLGMRRLALRFGAGLAACEMLAANLYGPDDHETAIRAADAGFGPHAVQIAGCVPALMA